MKIFKNASPLILANLTVSGINFLILPIISFHVSKDNFSTYAALASLQAALTTTILTTFGSSCVQVIINNNSVSTWKSCIVTERLFLFVAAFLFPVLCLLAWGVISDESYDSTLVLILAAGIMFRSEGTVAAIYRSNDKISFIANAQVIASTLKIMIVILVAKSGGNIAQIIAAATIFDLFLTLFLQAKLKLGYIGFGFNRNNYCHELVRRAKIISLGNISDSLVSNLDRLLVGYALSPSYIGDYHIMRKLSGILGMLTTPINQYLLPAFTTQKVLIRKKIYSVTIPLLIFFSVICFLAIVLYETYSSYIFQEPYSVRIEFFILLILQMAATSFCSVHPAMIALGYLSQATWITVISNVTFVISALWLTEKLGLIGMVIAIGIQFFFSITPKAILTMRAK